MIAIIDYEMGNLRSVQKGFERVGHAAEIISKPDEVARADALVLPGVGAFADAIAALRARGLVEPIRDFIDAGRPFLGICLGLHLLFDVSHEDGRHEGLGVLRGDVARFEPPAGSGLKVPHMGWNQIAVRRRPPLLDGIDDGSHFYFVHSYYVRPADKQVVAAETDYSGPFCSIVWRDNLFATQFHPEKSQSSGLQLLENFAALADRPAT